MKFDVKDGKASVSLIDLLDEFGEEGRTALIGFLAIEGRVIEAVVDLLIDGHTKEGAWISHAAGDAVEVARTRVLAAADKVMHEVAKAMLRDRQCAEASEKVYSTWAFRLYNAWPRNCGWAPHGPERIDRYPWPEGAEVDAAIEQKIAEIRAKMSDADVTPSAAANVAREMLADADAIESTEEDFRPRPIGKDLTPGCFVCGAGDHDQYRVNFAAFVTSRASGLRVVALFRYGARLDYRTAEPDWIQVKIGACDKHVPNLERLRSVTMTDNKIDCKRVGLATQSDLVHGFVPVPSEPDCCQCGEPRAHATHIHDVQGGM